MFQMDYEQYYQECFQYYQVWSLHILEQIRPYVEAEPLEKAETDEQAQKYKAIKLQAFTDTIDATRKELSYA